ncbi:MAG: four helix bundle protein [Fibrobacter sp.]|nr:four helix bundle protein [Fibrobacter sp.]
MRNFKSLEIWKKSHQFTLDVYKLTKDCFPKDELYGLTSQIRRSSASIPTNIAEGCGRKSNTELSRFLQISLGSATEAEYQLLLAKDLGYINEELYIANEKNIQEIKKMLTGFLKNLPPDT